VSVIQAIMLGITQGLTEFLPVSSSGHLVLGRVLLGIEMKSITFEVVVHFGTLVAVVMVFRHEVSSLLKGVWCWCRFLFGNRQNPLQTRDGHLLALVILGSIPAGFLGLLVKDFAVVLFSSPVLVGLMLILTGGVLYISDRIAATGSGLDRMDMGDGLWIGVGQALAIIPGLSRSGLTISAGLMRGLTRDAAARYSFLLSIPAIAGAAILELPHILEAAGGGVAGAGGISLLAGFVAAVLSGYAAIKLLFRFIQGGRLALFALYTWFAGFLVVFSYFL